MNENAPPAVSTPASASAWLLKLRQPAAAAAAPSACLAAENDAAASNGRRRHALGSALDSESDKSRLDQALQGLPLDDPLRLAFSTLAEQRGAGIGLLRHALSPEDARLHAALAAAGALLEDDAALDRLAAAAGGWGVVRRLAAAGSKGGAAGNDRAAVSAQREALASQVAAARRDCEALEATLLAADARRAAAAKLHAAKDIDSTVDEFRTFFRNIFPPCADADAGAVTVNRPNADATVSMAGAPDPVPAHLATSPHMREFLHSERRLAAEMRELLRSGVRQNSTGSALTWERCQLRDLVLMEELPAARDLREAEIERLSDSITEAHRQECLAATAMAHARSVRAAAQKCVGAGSGVGDVQMLALGLRPPQELRAELARLDDELRRLMNGNDMRQACGARGRAAIAGVQAMDAAIAAARNEYFHEHHAPVFAAYKSQQVRLEFVRAELERERSRFAEFVVESVTGAGKEYKDLVAAAQARMEMYETMLVDAHAMQQREHPLLDMLLGEANAASKCRGGMSSISVGGGRRRGARQNDRKLLTPEERAVRFSEGMRASLVKSEADAAAACKTIEAKISKLLRGRNVLLREGLGEGVDEEEDKGEEEEDGVETGEGGAAQGEGADDQASKLVVKGLSQMTPEELRRSMARHVTAKVELERRFREVSSSGIATNAYWRKDGDSKKKA
jgi:hypothetical protein